MPALARASSRRSNVFFGRRDTSDRLGSQLRNLFDTVSSVFISHGDGGYHKGRRCHLRPASMLAARLSGGFLTVMRKHVDFTEIKPFSVPLPRRALDSPATEKHSCD